MNRKSHQKGDKSPLLPRYSVAAEEIKNDNCSVGVVVRYELTPREPLHEEKRPGTAGNRFRLSPLCFDQTLKKEQIAISSLEHEI